MVQDGDSFLAYGGLGTGLHAAIVHDVSCNSLKLEC